MKAFVFGLVCFGLAASLSDVKAQVNGGFSPANGGAVIVPKGTSVTLHTTATLFLMPRGKVFNASATITGPDWTDVQPTRISAWSYGITSVDVTITIRSDSSFCPPGFPGVFMIDSSDNFVSAYTFGPVVFYDPTIIGHAISRPDTAYFWSVPAGDSASTRISVHFDSLVRYRSFFAINIRAPFYVYDSIPMNYICESGELHANVSFRPRMPGHYIDTALIIDPLTNDTLPLVLIGDAFDAGVSEEAAQPIKLYPNPCDRTLMLELPYAKPALVEIRNMLGETVCSSRITGSEHTIDCSALPEGVYLASLITGNSRTTRKVVVAH